MFFPPECTALLKRKGNIKKRKCSSRHRKERLESLTRKGEKGRREEREEDETRRHTAVESSPHQGRDVGRVSQLRLQAHEDGRCCGWSKDVLVGVGAYSSPFIPP